MTFPRPEAASGAAVDSRYLEHLMTDTAALRIGIVGGGLTGLAAAHHLIELAQQAARAIDVTLFEASERYGGVFGTVHHGEYTIETGADSFITNKPWAVDLCERLGLRDELIGTNEAFRRSLILLDGKPFPTPEGFELIVPRKLRALLASPFLSLEGKFRVAAEAFLPPRQEDTDESLADFVRRRFGQEALEKIVQPMVGGIYTSDPERLSMRATLPRFVEMERTHGSLLRAVWNERRGAAASESEDLIPSGARYGLFATLQGGMSDLLDALADRVQSRATMRLNTRVTSLMPSASTAASDAGYLLTTDGGACERFDAVILAVPSYVAADLVAPSDINLAESLRAIEYASSAIVVTGHRLVDVVHPLDAFGLVIPHGEGRRILAVSFLSRKFPGRAPEGRVILRTFVGGAMQPELMALDDAAMTALVQEELQAIFGVRGLPELSLVTRYERGMPQYHVGHLDRVAAIESAVARHPRLELAGNAYRGVGVPDCIHSGEQAAERLWVAVS